MPDIFVGSSYVKYFCCNIIKLLDFRFDTILGGMTLLRADDRGRIIASDTLPLAPCPVALKHLKMTRQRQQFYETEVDVGQMPRRWLLLPSAAGSTFLSAFLEGQHIAAQMGIGPPSPIRPPRPHTPP